jgi:hypothetical protein
MMAFPKESRLHWLGLFPALLSACVFQPTLPITVGPVDQPGDQPRDQIVLPPQGCLQATYEHRRRRGRHYYAMTELYKRGMPLSEWLGPALDPQLLLATKDDREAHAAALLAYRLNRASIAVGIGGVMAGLGLMWTALGLGSVSSQSAPPPMVTDPAPIALSITGLGLGLTSVVLLTALNARVSPKTQQAIAIYNEHAAAWGCPAPQPAAAPQDGL